MGVIEGIKDATRKASNSVVDAAENITGMPKSPKELAKRTVEHITHREYKKLAEVIIDEAKKYADKMGVAELPPVAQGMEQFEGGLKNLAEDLEDEDYHAAVSKLKTVESSLLKMTGKESELFKPVRNFIKRTIEVVEGYAKEAEKKLEKKAPDFGKLESVFEEYFDTLKTK